MREPSEKPDPFENPYCVAAGFACDPHEAWRLYLAGRREPADYDPFREFWQKAPLPPGYRP